MLASFINLSLFDREKTELHCAVPQQTCALMSEHIAQIPQVRNSSGSG